MTVVYYMIKSEKIPSDVLAVLADNFPKAEREEIFSLKNETVRSDTLLGRLVLRAALKEVFDIPPSDTVMLKGKNGKPYLRDHAGIYFSISHTSSCVACAVSNDIPVGLDTETVNSADHCRIAERMFTENERAYLYGEGTKILPERFYQIWTMKESFVKLSGDGISQSFSEFDVLDGTNTDGVSFMPFMIGNASACVCMPSDNDGVNLCEITAEVLWRML